MGEWGGEQSSVVCGPGAIASLPTLVASPPGRVTVVLTPSSQTTTWRKSLLNELGGRAETFEHETGAPTPDAVSALERLVEDRESNLLIAIGGGSAIDLAKAARARLAARRKICLAAVPTVPGAGTEVTPFASIWDFDQGRKTSVLGPPPDLVLLDPELSRSLVGSQLVHHAMDALTHGVEAAWSIRSTPESTAYGLAAVGLLVANLEAAATDSANLGARLAVGIASVHAGRAIAIAQTSVCHALSYPMTIVHRIGHAEASSLTLSSVLAFVANTTEQDCADPRGVAHVRTIVARICAAFGVPDVASTVARIDRLRGLAGFPAYRTYGFEECKIAQQALTYERIANTPRKLDQMSLAGLLLSSQKREISVC